MLKDVYRDKGFKYLTLDFENKLTKVEIQQLKVTYEMLCCLVLVSVNDDRQLVFKYKEAR